MCTSPGPVYECVAVAGMWGECVSVNECRCAAVNERLCGAEDGGQRGVRKRPEVVCARVRARVRERVGRVGTFGPSVT